MFDHYFSNLAGLFLLIETEARGDAAQYYSILQAQISSIEFGFIAYYRFLEDDADLSREVEANFVYRPRRSSFVRLEHSDWVSW